MNATTEQPVTFDSGGERLVGVLHIPQSPRNIGVVVVVGGPQYRAGSHRQFVLLARALSKAGYPVLRFDYSGMGDSSGRPRSFEHVSSDIGAAVDVLLKRAYGTQRVILWGLCDAASAALLYCDDTRDARISGLCLVNPWMRSDSSMAKAQIKHYYGRRIASPAFWRKLLSGRVAVGALPGFLNAIRVAAWQRATSSAASRANESFQQRMERAWADPSRQILLLLSGNDYTAREFVEYASGKPGWREALLRPGVQRRDMPGADHTFSGASARAAVETLTIAWLHELSSVAAPSAHHREQEFAA